MHTLFSRIYLIGFDKLYETLGEEDAEFVMEVAARGNYCRSQDLDRALHLVQSIN